MKKLFAMLMALTILMTMAACGQLHVVLSAHGGAKQ